MLWNQAIFSFLKKKHSPKCIKLKLSLVVAFFAGIVPVANAGQSYTFLESGFTQEVVGVSNNFLGGVAFAPDGDPWVNNCFFNNGSLVRFDIQTSLPAVNGTTSLHPGSNVVSNTGCGMTNHPDGFIYSNTTSGISQINATTGAATGVVFGAAGNALGIASDPNNNNLVHVGTDGTIYITPVGGVSAVLSTVATGDFIDGLYFDPSGQFIFMANRTEHAVTIIRRDGTLVQQVPMTSEPDGIAFHLSADFVVSSNLDGTLSKIAFPGNDYAQPPTISLLASGGFRGDLTQVGPDGCLYLTQDNTRYDDGTQTAENSLVKICPGFHTPGSPNPVNDVCAGSPPAGAIVGTEGNDILYGTAGDDVIFGLGGNDKIFAGSGNDLVCGGAGADVIKADKGNDTVKGGPGNDAIYGDAGDDKLDGDDGDDYIRGGCGKDDIKGGKGNDDLVATDFVKGNDIIDGGESTTGDICSGDMSDVTKNCEPQNIKYKYCWGTKYFYWQNKWYDLKQWNSSDTYCGTTTHTGYPSCKRFW